MNTELPFALRPLPSIQTLIRVSVLALGMALTLGITFSASAGIQPVRQQPPPDPKERAQRLKQQLQAARPIPAVDSVWIEDLTWLEVRDAMKAGKTTVLVTSGGVEQNGPYVVTGKHNVILSATCERIARALGDALCAPIIKLVPEGNISPPSGHMLFPGTLSVREETYRAVLEDVASSLHTHGFEHIVFLGDSGGNQQGMEHVATLLNNRWGGSSVHFIPEYYRYQELFAWLSTGLGIEEPENEGLHDNYAVTAMMMTIDPTSVRYAQRKEVGKAKINGVPIDPIERTLEVGEKLMAKKVTEAVTAILAAIASESEEPTSN